MKKIIMACDHGGLELKNVIRDHLMSNGVEVLDIGTYKNESCSYPDYAKALCQKIQNGEFELGILVCGTGIGMSIAANKHKGIRAALCGDVFSAKMTRAHNNANVLCLGARVTGPGLAHEICDAFFSSSFEGGRHEIRVNMLTDIENKQ